MPHIPDRVKRLMLGGRTVTVDGNTLDTTLQFLLASQRAAGLPGLVASDDVDIARTQLNATAAMFRQLLPTRVSEHTLPGPDGPLGARLYQPLEGDAVAPLLVYYHGGGFSIGGLETHDDLCRYICRNAEINVLSVDYRMAPEHKAPAAVDDAFAAYRWVIDHPGDVGADPARIAVGGDSAGGNLAAVVAQRCRAEGVRPPALQLLLYPITDICGEFRSRTLFAEGYFLTAHDMDWFAANYLDGSPVDKTDPRVSPLLADDLSGLAPALVLTAGFDPLRDEGNRYAEAMRAAGVAVDLREYGSLIHAFANFFPLGGGSATATAEMVSALRAHLSRL
ncbi:alpha/beta hydrolase [Mycolicibacterium thermoresistibile]